MRDLALGMQVESAAAASRHEGSGVLRRVPSRSLSPPVKDAASRAAKRWAVLAVLSVHRASPFSCLSAAPLRQATLEPPGEPVGAMASSTRSSDCRLAQKWERLVADGAAEAEASACRARDMAMRELAEESAVAAGRLNEVAELTRHLSAANALARSAKEARDSSAHQTACQASELAGALAENSRLDEQSAAEEASWLLAKCSLEDACEEVARGRQEALLRPILGHRPWFNQGTGAATFPALDLNSAAPATLLFERPL